MIKLDLNEKEKIEAKRVRILKIKAEKLLTMVAELNEEIMKEQIRITKEINLRLSDEVKGQGMTMVDLDNGILVAGSPGELKSYK